MIPELGAGTMTAAPSAATTAKSSVFFKAAGGKRQLLPELRRHVPPTFKRYFELFVGGGAFFFDLFARDRQRRAFLNDANPHMMAAYRAVKDKPDHLIAALSIHAAAYKKMGESYYYEVRAQEISPDVDFIAAGARFLLLNRTGFNGLYRVNRAGKFNVPHGKYTNPTICNEETLRAAHELLRGVALTSRDFADGDIRIDSGDFCYFDPPYWPASATADFTAYTTGGFGPDDQERLRDYALRLKRRGASVLLSNADVEPVRKLYAKNFEMRRVDARRAVNSDVKKRGAVGELLIW